MISESDTAALAYILVFLGIILFMAMVSPVMVSTKEYYFAYYVNLCPTLDLELRLGCLASVYLSGTEGCTSGFCSSAGSRIGVCWV